MKEHNVKKIFINGVLLLSLFIGVGIVSAKLVFGACVNISSGKSFTSTSFTAYSDDAVIELTPSEFTGYYSKKTLLSIKVKSGGSYVTAYQDTKTLGYACYRYNINDIGAGTWKVSLKQANATGTVTYAGMKADIAVNA